MYIPRTVMTRALADGEPVAYVPLRNVLMFGELAPKPGASPLQIAQGLKAISALVDHVANDAQIGEAWFTCTDRTEMNLCVKRGWEVVMHDLAKNMWLLRRRVPSSEPIK